MVETEYRKSSHLYFFTSLKHLMMLFQGFIFKGKTLIACRAMQLRFFLTVETLLNNAFNLSMIISFVIAAFFMLYNLRHIRKYLDQESAETLVCAFITSKIDYCNGLLFGLPESQTMKLQRIQNACARLVCNSSKFCHITPLLKTLHWLPVRQRIVFKILLIVFKALNGQAPSYILELLTLKTNSRSHNLRSSNDTLLLKMPTCKTKVTLGDRAFSCAAPKIWNNLPLSIRKSQSVTSFKGNSSLLQA